MASSREINILVSGGSTYCASSFVKALEIVVLHPNLRDAEASTLTLAEITQWIDGERDSNIINGAEAKEEVRKGASQPKAYVWRTKYGTLRFIDIPPMDHSEVAVKYDENFVNILSSVENIHAVILLFEGHDEARFERIQQNMSRISLLFGEHIMNESLMFVVVTHDGQGENTELTDLWQNLIKSKNTECFLKNANFFYFEQSWFEYLFARRNSNVPFSSEDLLKFTRSYENCVREYMRLICRLFESTVPYVCPNAQIVTNGMQILPTLTDTLRTLNDEVVAIGEEVERTITTRRSTISNLASEIDIAMADLERTKTVVQHVKIRNKCLELVQEEYLDTEVVHEEIKDKCQYEENETLGAVVRATSSKSDIVRNDADDVESGENGDDPIEHSDNVWNESHGEFVKEIYDETVKVVRRVAAVSPVVLLLGGLLGGGALLGAAALRQLRKQTADGSVQKHAEMDLNPTSIKVGGHITNRELQESVEQPKRAGVGNENESARIRPRTIKVLKTREVPKVVEYVKEVPLLKVVKEIDPVVQTKVAELQHMKQEQEEHVETLLKVYEHFTSEVRMVENFVKHLNTFIQEKFVSSNDEQCNTRKANSLQVNNCHVNSAEEFSLELEELYKLKYVGSSVMEALGKSSTNKHIPLDTIEMRCGYLFDRVVQRYAIMARLALKGYKFS